MAGKGGALALAVAAMLLPVFVPGVPGAPGRAAPVPFATEGVRLVPAQPAQVRAFLARTAGPPARQAVSVTYAVTTTAHRDGPDRATVVAARDRWAYMYRESPPLDSFTGDGTPVGPGGSFEVLSAVPGRGGGNVGPGLYSCARSDHRPWSCQGPYKGIGMGTTAELVGPNPLAALPLAISNAAYSYLPYLSQGALTVRAPERAYLFWRHVGGTTLDCLGFGPPRRLVGSACLEPDGLVATMSLSPNVSSSTYRTATLLSYSVDVPPGTFRLPARPTAAAA